MRDLFLLAIVVGTCGLVVLASYLLIDRRVRRRP